MLTFKKYKSENQKYCDRCCTEDFEKGKGMQAQAITLRGKHFFKALISQFLSQEFGDL